MVLALNEGSKVFHLEHKTEQMLHRAPKLDPAAASPCSSYPNFKEELLAWRALGVWTACIFLFEPFLFSHYASELAKFLAVLKVWHKFTVIINRHSWTFFYRSNAILLSIPIFLTELGIICQLYSWKCKNKKTIPRMIKLKCFSTSNLILSISLQFLLFPVEMRKQYK